MIATALLIMAAAYLFAAFAIGWGRYYDDHQRQLIGVIGAIAILVFGFVFLKRLFRRPESQDF